MNYFKNTNNEIFAYDNEQVRQGYGKDLISLPAGDYYTIVNGTPEFKKFKLDDTYTEFEVATDEVTGISLYYPAELQDALDALKLEEDKAKQIAEAKEYLASTDFYFTVDKYATLSEERKLELNTLRAEARVLINSLEG